MGRPKALRIISFKLDVDTLLELDRLAIKEKRYRSELIRDAIIRYLESTRETMESVR